MPSLREKYFNSIKVKKDHVSDSDIRDLLIMVNRLNSYTDLTVKFDNQIIDEELFDNLFDRLQSGEMIQYLLNRASFLGDIFFVNENVLIPRQETEQLVIKTKQIIEEKFKNPIIADICTGSGVIGIKLAKYFPNSKVFCSDISEDAIRVVSENKARFNADIEILIGDLINPILEKDVKLDVLVCNPPYIDKIDEIDSRTWKYEPHLALLASPSTIFYERIIKHIDKIMNEHFLVAFEIGEDMKEMLIKILSENSLLDYATFEDDLYGKNRYLYIMK